MRARLRVPAEQDNKRAKDHISKIGIRVDLENSLEKSTAFLREEDSLNE